MENLNTAKKSRRKYSDKFKAELVAEYLQGDQSLTAIAVKNGMNSNVLHRWVNEFERFGRHDIADFDDEVDQPCSVNANWLSILPTPQHVSAVQPKRAIRLNSGRQESKPKTDSQTINISVKSDSLSLELQWPSTDQTGLAKFIKELIA